MKLKRILTLLTSAAMAVTVLTGAMSVSVVSAADEDYATSGTCGDEAEWFINTDATLVITGKGALSREIDENGSQKTWPWRKLGADIQRIVIEEGIEDLGKGFVGHPNSSSAAFNDCINVKEAVLSPTVKNLYTCFYGMESNIKDIWIYATDIVEDVGGVKGGLSYLSKNDYPRAGRGTKWHIYKGSTTEQTLRDELLLTDDDIEYITEKQTFSEIKNYTNDKIELPKITETSGISGLLSIWEWNEETKTLTFSGEGTITISDGYYEKYKEKAEHIVIESGITSVDVITGYSLGVSCPSGAFCSFTKLEDVDLPDTLEYIGGGSFQNCTSLKKLVNGLPVKIKIIGEAAFRNSALSGDLILPSTLSILRSFAFENTNITSVNLVEGMAFGGGSFMRCDFLEEVVIPSMVYIQTPTSNAPRSNTAFGMCANLKRVIIKGVGDVHYTQYELIHENGIGDSLFSNCPSLKEIIIDCDNLEYISKIYVNGAGVQEGFCFDLSNDPTFYIYKDSTTEKTLRDAGYLTDTNVVYIANTTALEEAVKSAEEIDTSMYTDESVEALNKAIEAARAVVDDIYASQEAADNAAKAIGDAVAALKLIANGEINIAVKAPGVDTEVTVTVTSADGEVIYESTGINNTVSDLEDGEYVIAVTAENCAPRSYEVTVSDGVATLDAEIHIIGDINGDGRITTADVGLANSHAKGIKALEGYDIEVADLSKDGKVTTTDVGAVNAKAKGVKA